MKTGAAVSDKYQIQLKKSICCHENQTSERKIIPEFFYLFILVSLVTEMVLSYNVLSSCFGHKKVVFNVVQTSSEMLSLLHR